MISVSGYEIKEEILRSTSKVWLRANRKDDSAPMILKVPIYTSLQTNCIKDLENEFNILSEVDLNGVLKAQRKIRLEENLILEMEDFMGIGLEAFLSENRTSIKEKNILALKLISIVTELHHQHILIRDLRPHQFLINPETFEIKCIDLSAATRNMKGIDLPVLKEKLNYHPEYLSPEQTGRIAMGEDFRSDLYALGVTLYRLYTGQLPFKSNDLNEVIHAHLAKQVVGPHFLIQEFPVFISGIILKLLEKKPENRYQSAKSLKHDFRKYISNQTNGRASHFSLGELDQPGQFNLPDELFGREKETELTLGLLNQPSKSQLIFLQGNTGIGKSALAEHIRQNLSHTEMFFISGKCDPQLQQNPFGAVTQALKCLVAQVLKETAHKQTEWKNLILTAVGNAGSIIINEIPELELLTGKQPAVPEVPSTEALNRNIYVFTRFIHVFANAKRLLVIFLDDLHWADTGTLSFMRSITKESEGLIIIGTYKENGLDPHHPLKKTLFEIRQDSIKLTEINLLPLNAKQIQRLLSETLSCPDSEVISFAEVVFTRTLGNPLFIHQYLQTLHKENYISFNHKESKWEWDLNLIRKSNDLTSSQKYIQKKMEYLPEETQLTLGYAACIGRNFRLEILASLLDSTTHETAEKLKPASDESLINISKTGSESDLNSFKNPIIYSFTHEQIQQEAYALIPEELKKELHLNIGYILPDKSSIADIEKDCFEIVGHLNKGSNLITEPEDVLKIAGLNLTAGKKAKATTAFSVAFDYFSTGIQYLEHSCDQYLKNPDLREDTKWNTYYPVIIALYMQAAETAYLTGQFEITGTYINSALNIAQSIQEKTEAVLLQIQSFIYQKENEKALELALNTTRSLGIKIPTKGSDVKILSEFLKCKWILKGKKTEDLENLPHMTNQEILAAFKVIQTITGIAYLTAPKLYPLLILRMVYLSVKHGNAPQSSLAYATYGAIVSAIQTDHDSCYRFGQLAIRLHQKVEDKSLSARTILIYNLINRISKEHIHHSLEPLKKCFVSAIESGEIEYAVYASNSYCVLLLFSGKNLNWVKEEMLQCNTLPKTLQPQLNSGGNEALIQIISNYLGENKDPKTLTGDYFDEREGIAEAFKSDQRSKQFLRILFKAIFCYLLEDHQQAKKELTAASAYLDAVKGMLMESMYHFYHALVYFSLFEQYADRQYLTQAVKSKNKLKKWARQIPVNHLHKYLLLEAEHFKVTKKADLALEHYDKAIKLARENNHLHDEALANELAGKFWINRGQFREGAVYTNSAFELYKKWGCKLKTDYLKAKWGTMICSDQQTANQLPWRTFTENENAVSAFDLSTLMKASIAISSEVVFDRLLEKLMKVVIENAGAQTGYFILERFGTLFVEAKQCVNEEKVVLLKISLHDCDLVPHSIVQNVFDTKEDILIHDVSQDEQFKVTFRSTDEKKSVLCIPTINQGKLIGVLYLENNLATGAFTKERVEILKLLSGQIAVSIENSILYENLEQKVEERTLKIQTQKEEIEQQKQLVEEKSRYKEQFFTNMSHEIRTPMTAIIGMSELIFNTPLTPQQTEYAKGIKYSSENLLAIINDILDYSKIEAGKFTFVKKPFQIKERVNRLGYILQSMVDEKGIALTIHISPDITGQLIGDPLRLHQVLLNLASNAVKFTETGKVEISVEKISETESSEELLFSVKDTGIGIAEDKLQFIFETFSQIEDETSLQHSGTGLGLFIAKKLVEEQGGTMQVTSKQKQGTEFRFNLALEKSSVYQIQKKDQFERNLKGLNILLVEDNLFNQVVVEELLKIMIPEVKVTIANNGAIAIEKLESNLFDIVLMDVKMPVMDGYKATRTIRDGGPQKAIPILALTANASPLEAEKCKAAGMNDYLSKPIESQKLKEKIARLLN